MKKSRPSKKLSVSAPLRESKKEDGKPSLVPKLRFPEFQDARGWTATDLGSQCISISSGKDKITPEGQYDLYGSTGVIGKTTDANHIGKTILVARVGANAGLLTKVNGRFGVTDNTLAILLKETKDFDFIFYCLVNAKLNTLIFGSGQPLITGGQLKALQICVPTLPEQQKIASCLRSVDELMAAQGRKVDALKTHKKGLMQQLFPREGETQPRLRFPEFQNAGPWARMSIQEMIDHQFIDGHLDGNHGELYPKAEEFSLNKEGIPYITANDFINGSVEFSRCKRLPIERARQFKKGVAKDGDILFAHNATVGPVAKLSTSEQFVILSTTATYFRCNENKLSNDFLKSALSCPDFVAQYSRVMSQSTRNQVPITTQRKLKLHVPKLPEQRGIATCLSSLDALIASETQKHAALHRHKRSLMQQLFPSPGESS